jgi:phytanoyl-CoA hydroxylase
MTPTNTLPLQKIRQEYDRDGFVTVRQVLDIDLMQEAVCHVNWLRDKNPDLRPEQFRSNLMRDDPFWVRLISDERLLDVVEVFIGPNIALFSSHYICKPPHDGQAVLWHQDGSYWPLDPMEVVTLWLAVSDSTRDNGCMRVIPGTHDVELQAMQDSENIPNVIGSSIDESLVEESRAVDIELKAGDLSIHHPNVIHGSNANTSGHWRHGLTIRYMPTSTRILDPDRGCPFILRGSKTPGVENLYQPYPQYDPARHMPFRGCETWT